MKQAFSSWPRWKKALAVTGSPLAILVLVGLLWAHNLNENPVVHVPTPVMPSPNAFDDYVAAGNSLRDEEKISLAITQRPGAMASLRSKHIYSPAEKATLVAENNSALTRLRRGFSSPYLSPPARSIRDKFPYYSHERDLARLLYLQAQVRQSQGNWGGAADSSLDAIRLGEDVPHGSVMIGALVGIACQAIGRRPLWRDVDHLSASEARAAARRLEAIQAQRVPFADTMQEEEWFGQSVIIEIFRRPHWRSDFSDWGGEDDSAKDSKTVTVNQYMELNLLFVNN